jgi:hypothetical protein
MGQFFKNLSQKNKSKFRSKFALILTKNQQTPSKTHKTQFHLISQDTCFSKEYIFFNLKLINNSLYLSIQKKPLKLFKNHSKQKVQKLFTKSRKAHKNLNL